MLLIGFENIKLTSSFMPYMWVCRNKIDVGPEKMAFCRPCDMPFTRWSIASFVIAYFFMCAVIVHHGVKIFLRSWIIHSMVSRLMVYTPKYVNWKVFLVFEVCNVPHSHPRTLSEPISERTNNKNKNRKRSSPCTTWHCRCGRYECRSYNWEWPSHPPGENIFW